LRLQLSARARKADGENMTINTLHDVERDMPRAGAPHHSIRVPADPDAFLTRDRVVIALNEIGFPVTVATLATKATRGGGPPYRLFGKKPLYRWSEALAWAEAKLSAPRCNTSELLQQNAA